MFDYNTIFHSLSQAINKKIMIFLSFDCQISDSFLEFSVEVINNLFKRKVLIFEK